MAFWNRVKNPYVVLHKLKMQNDKRYKDYLKWCLSVNEIPMDKYDFIKEIADKERELEKITI